MSATTSTTTSIKKETKQLRLRREDFTEDELRYFDIERTDETLVRYTFTEKMTEVDYMTIAAILQQQYRLPVKYLEPDYDNCYYICQKSLLPRNDSKIYDAYVSIEPSNQNIFKQISYTPINQSLELGTVVTLHESVPYTATKRALLTSASLKCDQPLCNRCIPYSTIDIGSEIVGKFVVKIASPIRNSMTVYRFRRPADNVIEFVVPTYLNVDINTVLKQTKTEIDKNFSKRDMIKQINKKIDEMIAAQ